MCGYRSWKTSSPQFVFRKSHAYTTSHGSARLNGKIGLAVYHTAGQASGSFQARHVKKVQRLGRYKLVPAFLNITRPSCLISTPSTKMISSFIVLPFLALTSALALTPRQDSADLAPQLLSQIADLSTSVTQLTSAVNAFDGSLLGVLPQGLGVITAEKDVDSRVLKATRTAQDSSAFTAPESRDVLIALAGQIDPIKGSLEALKAKVRLLYML